ncbi:MAG: sulfatase-like hydrolase/transferase [Planctomycetota bacterium]
MTPESQSAAGAHRVQPRARALARAGMWRCALVTVAAVSCGPAEHPLRRVERGEAQVTGRGMLVIAIDGLRFDRTSLGRTDRDTTPFLRRLAAEGASFDDTWGTSTARFDAHVSLLTGADPLIGRRPPVQDSSQSAAPVSLPLVLPGAAPSVAVRFLAGGWTTAAFVDHTELSKVRGLDRGFQRFFEYAGRGDVSDRRGEGAFGVGARVIQWINARDLDEDWFAYVHLGDLERVFQRPPQPVPTSWHVAPETNPTYVPVARAEPTFHALPASRVGGNAASLAALELQYDAELAAVDRILERIVRHVDEFGRSKLVTVVIVGTYGVPFGESGLYLSPGLPDAPDLRVPWVMRPAVETGVPPGTHIEAIASIMDVAPTLLNLAGLNAPGTMHGLSRAAELRDHAAAPARGVLFARSHVGTGGCIVTDAAHWALFHPTMAAGDLAESWSGERVGDPSNRVRALGTRVGPASARSLEFLSSPEPERAAYSAFEALWRRWMTLTSEARDGLQFGGGRARAEIAAELRAFQGPTGLPPGS